jgi:hypothetical protein
MVKTTDSYSPPGQDILAERSPASVTAGYLVTPMVHHLPIVSSRISKCAPSALAVVSRYNGSGPGRSTGPHFRKSLDGFSWRV